MSKSARTPVTLESLRLQPDLEDKINNILKKRFIYCEEVASILATAIYSQQNVILFGPGGHGKSEMVEDVLAELGLWDREDLSKSQTLIMSFGEGMTEDALWGGINLGKLNDPTNPEMIFNVNNSFIKYPVAVFEEIFDAPPVCLLPLKHTLQAKRLDKNGTSYPVSTQLIVACTNRNPEDIEEMGETYKALLERFVLRQEVVWKTYKYTDYLNLIHTDKDFTSRSSETTRCVLAEVIASCQESGHCISPRTAMKALQVIKGAALQRTKITDAFIEIEDFMALRHIAGFSAAASKMEQELANRIKEIESRKELTEAKVDFDRFKIEYGSNSNKIVACAILAKQFVLLHDRVARLAVADSVFEERKSMLSGIQEYVSASQKRILDVTVV